MNKEEFLTIKDVCELLCVKESWIRFQILHDRIPYIKIGKLIRFRRAEIYKWIDKESE